MILSLLLLMNLLYAGAPAFMKLASWQMDPLQAVFMRHSIALLVFSPFFLHYRHAIAPRHLLRIAMTALVAFTTSSILQMLAIRHASATDGAIILSMEPLLMMLLAYFVLHEKWELKTTYSLGCAFIGFLVLSTNNVASVVSTSGPWLGNLLFLLAVLADASFPIFMKPLLRLYPPPLLAFYCLFFATLYLAPFQLTSIINTMPTWNHTTWTGILYLGCGCSFGACLIWLLLLKQRTVTMIALSWFLQPTLGCVYAYLLLQEPLTLPTLIGGLFILAALASTVKITPTRATIRIPHRPLAITSPPLFHAHHAHTLLPLRLKTKHRRPAPYATSHLRHHPHHPLS